METCCILALPIKKQYIKSVNSDGYQQDENILFHFLTICLFTLLLMYFLSVMHPFL